MQRRRNKVKDKPPPDPHREYLDAESSDEAERRDKEEEYEKTAAIGPRSRYSADELNELVRSVKDMTTLSGLRDLDWSPQCDAYTREFFRNPSLPILCIYHSCGNLTAEHSFPTPSVRELNYFARQRNEVFQPEDFRERVLFGSVNDNAESHTLAIIRNVLAPIFFTIDTWPDNRSIVACSFNRQP
ncbi:dynein heavy chain 2, axonemal-like [Harpegnathos saltator]|uniref:dynein heavy chain 2, axonemal-like n=1 Tax=Harpegnathos saltator TaxID=610380 RepID=UPI000948CD88|nr:dynein heavy chain 2, axonemal-like [Harpegnathos saltator]